ncbi:MAG TPA: VOC family protein [Chryseosolibacter sp.]|nr:VOC family protein [Chryseosolibacter sp.]
MEQRMSVLTIGADDLIGMRNFYSHVLGWAPIAGNKDIVFYKLNGCLLSICDRKMLADFIGVSPKGVGFRSTTIGYNVSSREEVLLLFERLRDKVTILKEPTEPPFGGLFFYFTDVEGNILEVAFNPFVILDKENNAVGHQPIDDM